MQFETLIAGQPGALVATALCWVLADVIVQAERTGADPDHVKDVTLSHLLTCVHTLRGMPRPEEVH
jgi:hypothetical protein